jgi:hypothetical protein
MLGRQKYELDRLVTQTAAELPRERRLADAFVNNDPFDTFHDWIAFPCQPRCSELGRPSYTQHRQSTSRAVSQFKPSTIEWC